MELGMHIADFTWNGGAAVLGPALARHARDAEDAGITRITVMDHFWQISGVGPAGHEMLEAYTTLGFLAAHTRTAKLHTLVTGVTYRQPGLLAKQISTLDVLSGGRAGLGIGAAWMARSPRASASTSPRSPNDSSVSKRPSRSACRCGPIPRRRTTAGTTTSGAPSTRRRTCNGRART